MGWTLAIETSHSTGSVALGSPTTTPVLRLFPPGLVHAREILRSIDTHCRELSVERSAIALVAVSAGPGSYTGVRVGVAAAKAIAYALGIPVIGISTLEIIAANVTRSGEFAVVLDARRGSCYAARFARGESITRLSPDRILPPEDFFRELPQGAFLVGETAGSLPGADRFARGNAEWDLPLATAACALGLHALDEIERGARAAPAEFEDPHLLAPTYLRLSEAEEKLRERDAKGGAD